MRAVYLAIGVTVNGDKEVLDLRLAQTEGAKFWLEVVTELKNRSVQEFFISYVDGLKGFPEPIEAVFPQMTVQMCVVHMVRHNLNDVTWNRRPELAADHKRINTAAKVEATEQRLGKPKAKWDAAYLPIRPFWRRSWEHQTPRFDFPPDIRKVISTSNAIESVNFRLRKPTKPKAHSRATRR